MQKKFKIVRKIPISKIHKVNQHTKSETEVRVLAERERAGEKRGGKKKVREEEESMAACKRKCSRRRKARERRIKMSLREKESKYDCLVNSVVPRFLNIYNNTAQYYYSKAENCSEFAQHK